MSKFWQLKIWCTYNVLVWLSVSLCLSLLTAPLLAADKSTKVFFPADYSVGSLTLLPQNWDALIPHPHGTSFGEARGSLFLPAHKVLMVRFVSTISDHPDALDKIPANVISILDLQNTGVEDNVVLTLQKVKNLSSVRSIDLSNTDITDTSVSALANWKNLENISLQSSAISGATIGKLAELKKLISLHIGSNNLQPQSFDRVSKIHSLKSLTISRTNFDDAAAAKLITLINVERIMASDNTKLTDLGLNNLLKLPRLTHLDLRRTAVTINGLKKLSSSKSMRSITLNKGQFGTKAEADLKKTLKTIDFNFEDRAQKQNEDLYTPLK